MLYAVMLFDTEINLCISTIPLRLFNYHTATFDNSTDALWYYANTPCYWSIMIESETEDDLAYKSAEAIENHQDPEYIKEKVLPYI